MDLVPVQYVVNSELKGDCDSHPSHTSDGGKIQKGSNVN